MMFVMLEPADDLIGQSSIVRRNGKPLLDAKSERRLRLVASSARHGFTAQQPDIQIQKIGLWLICFIVVNPLNPQSRLGECVVGIRRTPWTWVQRKFRLLDTRIIGAITGAGFRNDLRVSEALVAMWKGKVNANHTTTR